MKKLSLLFVTFSFIACSPKFYAPNRINIPELKKKSDFKISVAKGYLDFEMQSAFAISNNVGIMCNYVSSSHRRANTNFDSAGGKVLEVGIGYFSSRNNCIFENYFTIGKGSFFNRSQNLSPLFEDDDGILDADLTKLGFQSSLTYQHSLFSISGGLRLTDVNYNNVSGNMYYGYENLGKFLSQNSNYLFFEPAIQIGIGYENVRFNIQYQRSYLLNKHDTYYYTKYNYSAGVQLSFPAIGKNSKSENTLSFL